MEEMKPQQESTAMIQEPDVLTPSDGVASAIPANGATAQESPASDASAEVIQPRPAPPMDWKRFGAPLTVLMCTHDRAGAGDSVYAAPAANPASRNAEQNPRHNRRMVAAAGIPDVGSGAEGTPSPTSMSPESM
jgi:hypothetical protein